MKEKLYRFKRAIVQMLLKILHMKTDSEKFCHQWAELESIEFTFWIRHEPNWGDKSWRVDFYDKHRWNGEECHWNGHDVGCGEGKTLEDAWKDLEMAIFEYSHAKSREEALVKAELDAHRYLPRGWGRKEYAAYNGKVWLCQ